MGKATNRPLGVVTGASSGIGFELARVFIKNGFDLVIVAEDVAIHDAANKLHHEGAGVHSIRSDLATYEGVEALWAEIQSMARPVTAVAINAGVGVGGEFLKTDLEAELKTIQLNVSGAVHLAKRVLPDMVARRSGKLLFTSSIAATMPGPYEAVYAATKAFEFSFAEALRNELKGTGVTITALMPGPTDTHFFARAGLEDTRVGTGKKDDPADVARQGFEAMMAGKDKVVAGSLKNRLIALANQLLPEPIKAAGHALLTEPGSGKKA
jgi:uncharacterized protein